MILRHAFRLISIVVLMAALLLLYRIHPLAGWATLTMLAVVTVVVRRRKLSRVIAD